MRLRILAALAATVVATSLAGQSLAGTYSHQNPDGSAVALRLAVSGASVEGTLTTSAGQFRLQGQADGANLIGRVLGAPTPLFFQVTPQGAGVLLTLVGADASGQPDQSQLEHYAFERVGSRGSGGSGGSGGSAAGARGAGQGDAFADTFSGATLVLQLERSGSGYRGTATAQGTAYAVQATASGGQLQGTYHDANGSYPWTATLAGDVLTMYVDGQTVQLQRGGTTAARGSGSAVAGEQAPGGALSSTGREWDAHLRGKRLTQMESYYSGGDISGGYSNQRVLDLCRDGRFVYRDNSMVSAGGAGVGGYSGGSGGTVGQWIIIEVQGVFGLELRFSSGEVTQVRLDYQNNQTLLDGTRTFVTADNSSC